MDRKIYVVCGPTAVGKTKYAIDLALRLDGEVISADSMQLYKFMDIGSAKPTAEEQAMVPHHLVDIIDPREPFSVAEYQRLALEKIEELFSKGKVPVISGGTGLYVSSLIYDMDFSGKPLESNRLELERMANEQGASVLHDMLQKLDPEAADRIHPNNVKKVIRALEILQSGHKLREFSESFKPTDRYEVELIGLRRDRETLYRRIDERVDILMEMGLVDEVKSLMEMGLASCDISMKGIGYKEIIDYLNGAYDLDEAVRLVKRNTRHYAKRQMTWFKRYPEIKWTDL